MERTVSANGLAADAQLQKNRFVALWARISQVSQKPATLGNQGQQPLAGAMILFVRLEMLRQHRDSGAQQGNLYFWRPGVGFVALIPGENLLLCFNRQCHSRGKTPCLLFISFWYVTRIPQTLDAVGDGKRASSYYTPGGGGRQNPFDCLARSRYAQAENAFGNSMTVHLTPEFERLVESKVNSGRYHSASDVVEEALRLLDHRDDVFTLDKDGIREQIEEGWQSAQRGEL